MVNKGFLFSCFTTFLFLASCVVAFLAWIDPLALSPVGAAIEGINREKISRGDSDRLYRAYDPLLRNPEIIFLGTSRFNQAIDPTAVSRITGKRVYVAGLNGGTPAEMANLLEMWLDFGLKIETLVTEVYLWSVIRPHHKRHHQRKVDPINDFFRVFLSSTSIIEALDTLLFNRLERDRRHFLINGATDIDPMPMLSNQNLLGGFGAWWETSSPYVRRVEDSDMEPFHRIYALCIDYQIDCHFVITPIHPYRLAVFQREGLFSVFASMQTAVAKLANAWVFARSSPDTFHKFCSQTSGWHDPGHFSRAVGEQIVNDIFLPESKTKKFGRKVSMENVELMTTEWRQEVTNWREENPEFGTSPDPYKCPSQ